MAGGIPRAVRLIASRVGREPGPFSHHLVVEGQNGDTGSETSVLGIDSRTVR
jgi:hypothetical protein